MLKFLFINLLNKVYKIIGTSVVSAATLTLTMATAQVLVWYMTTEKVPIILYELITASVASKYVLLFALCGLFFIVGLFMNVATAVIILGPMLLPLLNYYQIDLIQFGIVAILMAQIGFISPPFGLCTFVSMKIFKSTMLDVVQGSLPFIVALFITVLLALFIPSISTFLPNLIFK